MFCPLFRLRHMAWGFLPRFPQSRAFPFQCPSRFYGLRMELFFLVVFHCISLVAAGHALLTKTDPRAALGWTATLVFLPVIGLAIYLVFGISRAQSRAEKIMRRIAELARQYPHPTFWRKAPLENPEAGRIAGIADRLTTFPLYPDNEVTPFHNGDEAYPAMLDAINQAQNHVFLSTYIFNYGEVAQKFIAALSAAKKRGVDTRVLVDGIGALYSLKKPWKILRELGVPTTRFRPPKLFPPQFGINLRSHRKVLVCDSIGFTGGMNISDGNVQTIHRKGLSHIQDMQFRFQGPIVAELRQAFLLNWSFCTGQFSPLPKFEDKAAGPCNCRVVVDGPGNDADALYDIICGAIDLAQKNIRIMTPYFLPPSYLYGALRQAAQRGVDTRVILPGINNLAYMSWATERILPDLLKAGVRIWHQAPPFAHTKLLAIDGFYSLVGSANLDSRSLKLNFELNMEIYDEAFHKQLADYMDSTLVNGQEVTCEKLQRLSLPVRLRDAASWIFSPYF